MDLFKEEFINKLPKIYSDELLDSLFYKVYTRKNCIEEKICKFKDYRFIRT